MPNLDYTAFVTTDRDERGLGHHTLRACIQDLQTFARYTQLRQLADPISREGVLAYRRYMFTEARRRFE